MSMKLRGKYGALLMGEKSLAVVCLQKVVLWGWHCPGVWTLPSTHHCLLSIIRISLKKTPMEHPLSLIPFCLPSPSEGSAIDMHTPHASRGGGLFPAAGILAKSPSSHLLLASLLSPYFA